MPQYSEQDLLAALSDIRNGKSLRLASREWGVPFSTLRNRIQGSESHAIAAESQQKLSKSQEDHLTAWVLTQEALGELMAKSSNLQIVFLKSKETIKS
jgi:hypothetical protein